MKSKMCVCSNSREDINDDSHVDQPKFLITPESIEKLRDFFQIYSISSLRFMKMGLGKIRSIMTEHLSCRKLYIHFVRYQLTDDQKFYRIQHYKGIIKEAKEDENFL